MCTVNPATNAQAGPPIPVGDDVDDLSVAHGAIWVTTYNDGLLARIEPSTRAVTWTKKLGGRAAGVLAASEGGVWVSLYDRGVVERVDPGKRSCHPHRPSRRRAKVGHRGGRQALGGEPGVGDGLTHLALDT